MPTAHHWYAMSCLVPMGRLDEALEEMRLAQSLDPVSSIVARDLAVVHAYRRDYEAALEQCDHTIELNPHFSPAYWALGFIQEQRKDLDEAVAAFQRAIDLSPQSPRMHAGLGAHAGAVGQADAGDDRSAQARRDREAALRVAVRVRVDPVRARPDRSRLPLARKAVQDRAFDVIAIKVDPRFESLKRDKRLEAIIREMGLS